MMLGSQILQTISAGYDSQFQRQLLGASTCAVTRRAHTHPAGGEEGRPGRTALVMVPLVNVLYYGSCRNASSTTPAGY